MSTAQLPLLYAAVGVAAIVLVLVSRQMRRWPVTEPLVGLALGVLLGPAVAGWLTLDDAARAPVLLESARILLAWSVMAAALRFSAKDLRSLLPQLALLVAVIMPVAALISSAAALLLGVPVAVALVIGTSLSPTDPVLAASVVSGEPAEEGLPARLRALLTGESGANDGLALPLVGVAIALAVPHGGGGGEVAGRLAWEVLGGAAIGAILGAAAAFGIMLATKERSLSGGPELVLTLLLALGVLGVARLASTGGVLAVFVAGLAYNHWCGDDLRVEQDSIDEAVNRYAVVPFFVLFGAVLPWEEWGALGWPALAFVPAVFALRRLPAVLLLRRPLALDVRQGAFLGWFGPMGVSAVFYLMHSRHEGVLEPEVWAAGSLTVAVSVVIYGVTAAPGVKAFARSASSD